MVTQPSKGDRRGQAGFLDSVREAVRTSGMSRYYLAQQSGVDEAALSRFVRGAGLSMESLDSIAEVLGLGVTVRSDRSTAARQAVETELEL
jgi:transcriptional regulator with XRE-family HTH domain